MEVFFGVNKNIILESYKFQNYTYRFVQKNTTQEIVEHFTDFWVTLNIFFMGFNKLVLTDREILKDLVIKVYFT